MMRPNLAQDAPPTALTVGGVSYSINVDFRVWIDVMHEMRDLITAPKTIEHAQHNVELVGKIEQLVFGKIVEAEPLEVLARITEFCAGYPDTPYQGGDATENAQTYSFDYDLNNIIIAIMNQFHIDLTYRRKKPFHWWEFLAYFRALAGNHYILRLMEIRGYTGKDTELKKQARRYTLPRENNAEDRAMLDEFDALFYNA